MIGFCTWLVGFSCVCYWLYFQTPTCVNCLINCKTKSGVSLVLWPRYNRNSWLSVKKKASYLSYLYLQIQSVVCLKLYLDFTCCLNLDDWCYFHSGMGIQFKQSVKSARVCDILKAYSVDLWRHQLSHVGEN